MKSCVICESTIEEVNLSIEEGSDICLNCKSILASVDSNITTLKKMVKYVRDNTPTCGVCSKFCGNEWCPTKD